MGLRELRLPRIPALFDLAKASTAVETLRIYQVPTARRRLAIIESMPPVSALLLEIIT
jgi:hypothetical protein